MMAIFIARKIMEEVFDYATIFSVKVYVRYQDEVDEILIAEGKGYLIDND